MFFAAAFSGSLGRGRRHRTTPQSCLELCTGDGARAILSSCAIAACKFHPSVLRDISEVDGGILLALSIREKRSLLRTLARLLPVSCGKFPDGFSREAALKKLHVVLPQAASSLPRRPPRRLAVCRLS